MIKNNIKKFGTEYPLGSQKIRDKGKITNLERYGVDSTNKVHEVKEKKKRTNLEKFGVEWAISSKELRDKTKKTWMENRGVDNPFQCEEVKDKIKETNLSKYGSEWFGGRKIKCPHCNIVGGQAGMQTHHFDNCKNNPDYKPNIIECSSCNKKGISSPGFKRWHFDKCRNKNIQ
jgi:hypothetical protein